MDVVIFIALGMLAVATVCVVARLVRPGSLSDRIVALDLLLVVIVSGLAVASTLAGGIFLDVLVVAALLGFAGSVTVARYIERRGS